MNQRTFSVIQLDESAQVFKADSIRDFLLSGDQFQALWNLHPQEFHKVVMYGKEIPTPRWQQSYGKNYNYTGSLNNALPISDTLRPYLEWTQKHVDERLNGLLLNWYDGQLGHYIGPHRDDTRDLHQDSPIVTISLGEERMFRMRKYKQKVVKDLRMENGSAIVIPWDTNLTWTHEVPKFKKYSGKRISVTMRAYL